MSATEVVKKYFEAVNAGDIDAAAEMLADDFTFSGPVPEPIGKMPYVGLTRLNAVAFPDWTFHPDYFHETGEVVTVPVRITGTHTGDWDLSSMGMGVIPATNMSFNLPPEAGDWMVRDGKITAFTSKPSPTHGMPGILSALGIKPPSQG